MPAADSFKKKNGFRKKGGRKVMRSSADSQVDTSSKISKPIKEKKVRTLANTVTEQSTAGNDMNAYGALLVLLNSEKKAKEKKTKARKPKIQGLEETEATLDEQTEDGNQEGEVEGFVSGEEDEGDEEEEGEEVNFGEADDSDSEREFDVQISNPFEWHFHKVDSKVTQTLPASSMDLEWSNTKYPCLPVLGEMSLIATPNLTTPLHRPSPESKSPIQSSVIKEKLQEPFKTLNPLITPFQSEISKPLLNYQDILFPGRTVDNEKELQNLYTMHILNHIYKTRDKVIKNNHKLSSQPDSDLELRDQGFTRPKALVLLPTRNACYEFITTLLDLSGLEQSENKKRFKSAFYSDAEPSSTKPADYIRFFSGNNDDVFCLGVKFTRKSVKLYSSFYSSDLIVASPLGLRMIVGNEGDKKRDFDFMSSLEVVVVDQADAMQMQSWDNVDHIFKYMSKIPMESHGCDFSRVRPWYLDDQSRYFRQTIILSQFVTPEINSLFAHKCYNIGGKIKYRPRYKGSMSRIGMKIRQTFSKLTAPNLDPTQDPDARFKYLTTVILPSLIRGNPEGTLIFIPSYLDFTRIRNYMDKENMSFSGVSEYSTSSQLGRARTYFNNGTSKFLLYTERLHHFRRYDIKGAKTVVFFGLPENPRFYEEITRFLGRTVVEDQVDLSMVRVRAVYSQWDAMKLERIVGSDRVGVMYKGSGETYEFQ